MSNKTNQRKNSDLHMAVCEFNYIGQTKKMLNQNFGFLQYRAVCHRQSEMSALC